jgi:VanZ family protein
MLEQPPRGPEGLSWFHVCLWAGLIFATVPVARGIRSFVVEHLSRDIFLAVVLVAIAVTLLYGLRSLHRAGSLTPLRLGILVAVAASYTAFAYSLRDHAEEAIHFLQYGVLGVLAFRALSHRTRDASIYLAAACVGGMVGVLDEFLQWVTPRRVWDPRDLGLNLIGAGGVQVALAFGVIPPWIEPRFRRSGLRRLCRIAATALAMLGLSLLNTPPRIAAYAGRVPGLGFLVRNGEVMLEYGTLHEIPGVAVFPSRFTPSGLAEQDRTGGKAAGRILAELGDDALYHDFLRRFSPISDPFLHEARVRLFRRDRFIEHGDEHHAAGEQRPARQDWTVAWRENLILEMRFAETLRHSARDLPPDRRRFLGERQLPDEPYESRVGRELVTSFRERHLISVLALGFAALAFLCWKTRERQDQPLGSGSRGSAPLA